MRMLSAYAHIGTIASGIRAQIRRPRKGNPLPLIHGPGPTVGQNFLEDLDDNHYLSILHLNRLFSALNSLLRSSPPLSISTCFSNWQTQILDFSRI